MLNNNVDPTLTREECEEVMEVVDTMRVENPDTGEYVPEDPETQIVNELLAEVDPTNEVVLSVEEEQWVFQTQNEAHEDYRTAKMREFGLLAGVSREEQLASCSTFAAAVVSDSQILGFLLCESEFAFCHSSTVQLLLDLSIRTFSCTTLREELSSFPVCFAESAVCN